MLIAVALPKALVPAIEYEAVVVKGYEATVHGATTKVLGAVNPNPMKKHQ